MKGKTVSGPCRLISQGNPLKLFLNQSRFCKCQQSQEISFLSSILPTRVACLKITRGGLEANSLMSSSLVGNNLYCIIGN